MKRCCTAITMAVVLWGAGRPAPGAEVHVFARPSDDRWHYPFNFTPGRRPIASTFGAGGLPFFNDRDGAMVIAWDTTASIEPGRGPETYNLRSITIELVNIPGAEWPIDLTVDEWFTYDVNGDGFLNGDGFPRGDPNDTDGESDDEDPGRPIELFGAGFGPVHAYTTWHERSPYVGSDSEENIPRDPFPFVYADDTGVALHVSDCVKGLFNEDAGVFGFTPIPWAIGVPIDYEPGNQNVRFTVRFEVDLALSDGRVRRYFQEQLDGGRFFVIVTSLSEAFREQEDSQYPAFFTKEGNLVDPDAPPPRLEIVRANRPGDANGDGRIDLDDYDALYPCLRGPGVAIEDPDCAVFDLEEDDDVDLRDAAGFMVFFGMGP